MAEQDGATRAAWEVYVERVQRVMNAQWLTFSVGGETSQMTIAPPSATGVAAIQSAIDSAVADARRDVIHAVLEPIVSVLDEIDNSKTKNSDVKKFRAQLQKLYEAMHALKAGANMERT